MFIGEYQYTIDDKGRVNFPAKFREEMGANFIVTRWLDNCLIAFPETEWERISSLLAQKRMVDLRQVERFIYASATQAAPDKQGRILLSNTLRTHASIEKDITIIGVGKHAEIWSTTAWQEMNANLSSEVVEQAMATLDF